MTEREQTIKNNLISLVKKGVQVGFTIETNCSGSTAASCVIEQLKTTLWSR
jgi:hypothetical protein